MINQNNPLQPLGTVTADLQMNAYHQRYTALTASLNEQVLPKPEPVANPFAPQTGQNTQDKKKQQIEQWLAPIDRAQPIRSAEVNAKKQKNYEHHYMNDPAIKEAYPMIQDMLSQLMDQVNQGAMTADQANDIALQHCDEFLEPILDKHHTGTDSHHVSMLSDPIKPTPKLLKGAK